jgi:hypothetical protein
MSAQTEYIKRVLATLQNNPTNADLDFLVEAHASIGYLAATAESDAEMAEAQRKYDEATAAARIREDALVSGIKVTADTVTAKVAVETFDSKKAEVKAYEKARKLKNLLESVEQAINAIKFIGRTEYSGPTGERDVVPR